MTFQTPTAVLPVVGSPPATGPGSRLPVLVKVLGIVVGLVVVLAGLLFSPAQSLTASADTIGEREVVQLAGRTVTSHVNVNNRSRRSTQVLLGRADIKGFEVVVGKQLLTSPDRDTAPGAWRALTAWGAPAMDQSALLSLIPLAALLIVLLRVVAGMSTLGTFSPVLLAISYAQVGLLLGAILTVGLFVLGFLAQPLLRRLHLPRVARLAALVGVVVAVLLAVQLVVGELGNTLNISLPVVVTAVITERLWEQWDADGARAALVSAGLTLAVGVLVAVLMLTPLIRFLADEVPLSLALACGLWTIVAGTYRGLRLAEFLRFSAGPGRCRLLRPAGPGRRRLFRPAGSGSGPGRRAPARGAARPGVPATGRPRRTARRIRPAYRPATRRGPGRLRHRSGLRTVRGGLRDLPARQLADRFAHGHPGAPGSEGARVEQPVR